MDLGIPTDLKAQLLFRRNARPEASSRPKPETPRSIIPEVPETECRTRSPRIEMYR
jgi:hypothetical protein